jgi:hypothetical protein
MESSGHGLLGKKASSSSAPSGGEFVAVRRKASRNAEEELALRNGAGRFEEEVDAELDKGEPAVRCLEGTWRACVFVALI